MKSYLSLIPISAKVHRRQNRMTLLCIVFAVFLVTAVFSMAEMGVRMETERLLNRHGSMVIREISDNPTAQTLYLAAALLFLIILLAGVLMISGSINSNVAQRTKFFGMMRCIGMSRKQIIRFVRLEALNWCKTAIPIGIVLGIIITWGLCAALRVLVGGEFSDIPLFGISLTGIVCGVVIGIVTVLIAAGAPAKRASQVSPVTAVSGNSENAGNIPRGINRRFFRIETALGINHAVGAKKNLILMMSSFALSIIPFLSFSVLIDFVGYLMPQSSNSSDIDISSEDGSNSIAPSLLDEIGDVEGVKQVYGRRSLLDISAEAGAESPSSKTIDIISYDDFDLECLVKDRQLKAGSDISKVYGNSNYALIIWDKDIPLTIGDRITVENESLEIAGMLKYNPFSDDGRTNGKVTVITSGQTFERVTGIADYSLIMVQTTKNGADQAVNAIRSIADGRFRFSDRRSQNTAATYMAFVIFIYGFLLIITLVTILNIMNSISLSVSARIGQYGAMRAVGMDEHQITRMIASEAFTYALSGGAAGCVVGLAISKLLYDILITPHFDYAVWSVPVVPLAVIVAVVLGSAVLAVYNPSRRIRNISVTETINEL